MLRIDPLQAVPGMRTALPVLDPTKPGHVLLKPRVELEGPVIAKLREMRLSEIWIEFGPLEMLADSINPRVSAQRARLTAMLGEDFEKLRANPNARPSFGKYAEPVTELLDRIGQDLESAMYIQDTPADNDPLLAHSSNVCFLSLLMGMRMQGYIMRARERVPPERARQLDTLGLGALLHDVGMLRITDRARERWETDADETDIDWRRHVVDGYKMVREQIPATASATVLHHHQRYDGAGFPLKTAPRGEPVPLAGDDIHVFARIVAVAEQFDRLRHPPRPPHHPPTSAAGSRPMPTVRALSMMHDLARAGTIDPVAFAALLSVVPAYPLGSCVTLSSGRKAVVTGCDPAEPCRPRVAPVIVGSDGPPDRYVLDDEIDLRQRTDELIVEADGRGVQRDNFFPSRPGEFDVHGAEYLLRATPAGRRPPGVTAG